MKRVISMMLLTLACLFSAACAHPQGYIDFTQPEGPRPAVEQTGVKPLRIAFASVMSPRETRQVYQQIVTYISQKQQWPAVLIQRRTYEELNALLANGDADVAFSSTGAYAAYQGQVPIELLAMAETNGTSHYQTYIITAADSDIHDFSQLRGKVFAFTDPLSYSGCLAIKFLLARDGSTPETFFNRFFYTHGHDNHCGLSPITWPMQPASTARSMSSWPTPTRHLPRKFASLKPCRKPRQVPSSSAVI